MTVEFIKQWNGYEAGDSGSFSAATEADLVRLGFASSMAAGTPAMLSTDASGNTVLVGADVSYPLWSGSHVPAVVIGDSISNGVYAYAGVQIYSGTTCPWTWLNGLIGAPFHFTNNLGIGGDRTVSIFSRIEHIPHNAQCVFVLAGTNDLLAMSAAANQATIDATYSTVSAAMQSGVNALVAAGKVVVIGTIPPNNGFTPSTDSRIQLLDRLNAFIATLSSTRVFVADFFTALWDSTLADTRVFKANTFNDATHPSSNGAMLGGKAGIAAGKLAYAQCLPTLGMYDGWDLCRPLYSNFRSGTGGDAAVKTNGTGNLADGWRSRSAVGTPTFTLDNTEAYAISTDYVGAVALAPAGYDSNWQEFNISSAALNDDVQLTVSSSSAITNTTNYPDNIFGGDLFFVEMDVYLASPVNLKSLELNMMAYFTAGTAPADQPYVGTTYHATNAGVVAAGTYSEGWRSVLRSPVLRVPENISTAVTSLVFEADAIFSGAGSAVVKYGRPRIWHKSR